MSNDLNNSINQNKENQNNEKAFDDPSWEHMMNLWHKQEEPNSDIQDSKMSGFLEIVRQKERKDILEFLVDIGFSLALIAMGVWIFWSFVSFYPLFPDQAYFESFTMGVNNTPIPASEVKQGYYSFMVISMTAFLGLVALGIYLFARSYSLRQQIWKTVVLSTDSAAAWFLKYFDTKLQLCAIGKKIAVGFLLIALFVFMMGLVITNQPIDSVLILRLLKGFVFVATLPVVVYLAAMWQERKFRQVKANYIEQFEQAIN